MLNIVLICDSHELWGIANAFCKAEQEEEEKDLIPRKFTGERNRIFLKNIGRVNFTKYGTFFKVSECLLHNMMQLCEKHVMNPAHH